MVFGFTACDPGDNGGNNTEPTTCTVTFDVQDHGTAPKAQTVNKGGKAAEPAAPTEEGWTFGGWYKEKACENKYDFDAETVEKDITLYAKWTKKANGGLPSDKTPTIYLAGDSTVKTYNDAQYIAGWGQYLNLFLESGVKVANAANGGRSSRSFINEGRLYDIDDPQFSYTFSENNKKSIGSVIEEGDYLFIQFGHNDDDSKKSSLYSNLYDRMVPLGTPDASGIYPTTGPTDGKVSTEHLPQEYIDNVSASAVESAKKEIAKYGSTYYSYDCGATYKWYLKQYVDFARQKKAIPVLVTPVARVAFKSDGTLKDGAGLHGEDFAYVKAVRQLADEEDCLLIDLFAETKDFIETATQDYAKFLMALVPNSLTGVWPTGYDTSYNNPDSGYTGIESTHYNKYGAFITAAKIAEYILSNNETHQNGTEYYTFTDNVKTAPASYLNPSNLISKKKVAAIEALFEKVSVTDPDREYPDPAEVTAAIAAACTGEVTGDNYLEYQEKCEAALALYLNLNIDDRNAVTNYPLLQTYLEKVAEQIEAHRQKPTRIVAFDPSNCTEGDITDSKEYTVNEKYTDAAGEEHPAGSDTGKSTVFTLKGGSSYKVGSGNAAFEYNGKNYSVTKFISLGGSASFGNSRYVEFSVSGECRVVVAAKSTGSDDRTLNFVNASATGKVITTFDASGAGVSVTYFDLDAAGTYQLGSSNKGAYLYYVLIEYTDHTHTPSQVYGYNTTNHWLTCAVCGEGLEPQPHDFENGRCNICGLPDLTDGTKWDVVTTMFDYAAAFEFCGSESGNVNKTASDFTNGPFTVATGVYFYAEGINTQSKDITVVLTGLDNTVYFEGLGASSTATTQFTLWKGNVEVTPAGWATEDADNKTRREFSASGLAAGTYTIKTNYSGWVYGLKIVEYSLKA